MRRRAELNIDLTAAAVGIRTRLRDAGMENWRDEGESRRNRGMHSSCCRLLM